MSSAKKVAAVGAVLLVCGCENGGIAVNYHEHGRGRVTHVAVAAGHVCGPACDHYWDGTGYVVVRRHRHGPGCGHVLVSNRWVIVERPVVVEQRPVVVEHGVPVERRVAPPAPPVRRRPEREANIRVDDHGAELRVWDRRRGVYVSVERGHVHGPRCGHVHRNGRWEID